MHRQCAFESFPRTDTPHADRLAATTLGLPFWIGIPPEAPAAIAAIIADAI